LHESAFELIFNSMFPRKISYYYCLIRLKLYNSITTFMAWGMNKNIYNMDLEKCADLLNNFQNDLIGIIGESLEIYKNLIFLAYAGGIK